MQTITIDTKNLKVGMFVSGLDRPWEGTPFMFQGFLIKNEKQITKLQNLCRTVQVDQHRSDESVDFSPFLKTAPPKISSFKKFLNSLFVKKTSAADIIPEYVEKPFEEEIAVAQQVYTNTTLTLQRVLEDFRLSKEVSPAEIKSCVHGVIDGVIGNPNALALLSNLKSKQQDSVRHSINVSILCLLFGRYLGFTQEQLTELGYASLLHDVGEIKVPQEILNKNHKRLSLEEKKIMESHTEWGAEILRKIPQIPEVAATVALSHHERFNGRGYPHGLIGAEIDSFSKLVAIVDTYETVTNNPAATIQVSSSDALKSIYSLSDSYFDRRLVEDFIKCLGIYPIGSVIELNTGELAIVITIKPGKHLLPTVMLIKSKSGLPYYPPKVVNLDQCKDSDGVPLVFIVKVVPPESAGIDLTDYLIRELGMAKV
jgi:putative nucleotidyltransferase with HDIG domain